MISPVWGATSNASIHYLYNIGCPQFKGKLNKRIPSYEFPYLAITHTPLNK